jgi:hypothetical protein
MDTSYSDMTLVEEAIYGVRYPALSIDVHFIVCNISIMVRGPE